MDVLEKRKECVSKNKAFVAAASSAMGKALPLGYFCIVLLCYCPAIVFCAHVRAAFAFTFSFRFHLLGWTRRNATQRNATRSQAGEGGIREGGRCLVVCDCVFECVFDCVWLCVRAGECKSLDEMMEMEMMEMNMKIMEMVNIQTIENTKPQRCC
jgi:hypothetical protein